MLVGKVFFHESGPLFDICQTQVGYAGLLVVGDADDDGVGVFRTGIYGFAFYGIAPLPAGEAGF